MKYISSSIHSFPSLTQAHTCMRNSATLHSAALSCTRTTYTHEKMRLCLRTWNDTAPKESARISGSSISLCGEPCHTLKYSGSANSLSLRTAAAGMCQIISTTKQHARCCKVSSQATVILRCPASHLSRLTYGDISWIASWMLVLHNNGNGQNSSRFAAQEGRWNSNERQLQVCYRWCLQSSVLSARQALCAV